MDILKMFKEGTNCKTELRTSIKVMRKQIDFQQKLAWDQWNLKKILEQREIQDAFTIYCYMSMRGEADTEQIIRMLWKLGKKTAVPAVEGNEINFYYITSMEDLQKGCMGILEPKPDCEPAEDKNAPVIVPGVAFDKKCSRLGYGGGYYDRFFEKEPMHYKIGIAYPFQMVDEITVQEHDIPMDVVLDGKEKVGD